MKRRDNARKAGKGGNPGGGVDGGGGGVSGSGVDGGGGGVSGGGVGGVRKGRAEAETFVGVVDMTSSGSMYVVVDQGDNGAGGVGGEGGVGDIFVDARDGGHALDGDKVEVVVTRRKHGGRGGRAPGGASGRSGRGASGRGRGAGSGIGGGDERLEGEIVKVLERSRRNYVGVLDVTEHAVFLRPDTRKIPVDIYIRRSDEFSKVSPEGAGSGSGAGADASAGAGAVAVGGEHGISGGTGAVAVGGEHGIGGVAVGGEHGISAGTGAAAANAGASVSARNPGGGRPAKQELRNGQKAVVKIVDWTEGSKCPIGEVVEVLGETGDNDTEMHAIMAEFDLPWRFDPRVERAADAIPGEITAAEIARRRDFRNVTTFTIDPEDAKDFDDALSIRRLDEVTSSDALSGSGGGDASRNAGSSGGDGSGPLWEIGVHIADVTHYVSEGSVVDNEGEERATSVYLVDRTIPMLPERLSNDLCSLRPLEEKLCFSAVFVMDEQLTIHSEWFGRTVIRSDRRFSYEQAQRVIETGEGDYATEILKFNELAQAMRRRRFAKGAVSFDREEFKFRLDDCGRPTGVYHKVMKESNQLIEEFMLLANKQVAEFIGRNRDTGRRAQRTFVYRVHDQPDEEKLLKFSDFVIRFGYYFRPDRIKDVSRQMNALLAKIKGRSEENVISTLAIRTMAKAFYSTENIGHYGLAFPYYTHFTSPIRRYPDMMVHRLLAHYLGGGRSAEKQRYERLCEHSSQMEVRAAEAERASVKYKMAEFMLERVGQEFDGHISGITDWGIYVELNESLIEGMVSMRDVADDFYRFDENIYAAVGQASGRKFTLGDQVRIRVKGADLARRQIDFLLVATIDFETGKVLPLPEVRPRDGGFGRRGDERVFGRKRGKREKREKKEKIRRNVLE